MIFETLFSERVSNRCRRYSLRRHRQVRRNIGLKRQTQRSTRSRPPIYVKFCTFCVGDGGELKNRHPWFSQNELGSRNFSMIMSQSDRRVNTWDKNVKRKKLRSHTIRFSAKFSQFRSKTERSKIFFKSGKLWRCNFEGKGIKHMIPYLFIKGLGQWNFFFKIQSLPSCLQNCTPLSGWKGDCSNNFRKFTAQKREGRNCRKPEVITNFIVKHSNG